MSVKAVSKQAAKVVNKKTSDRKLKVVKPIANPNNLKFRIGPYTYEAFVSSEPIIKPDPETGIIGRQHGWADGNTRTVMLDFDLPLARYEEILIHELTHCFEFHIPTARTSEEKATLSDFIFNSILKDIESQCNPGETVTDRIRRLQLRVLGN